MAGFVVIIEIPDDRLSVEQHKKNIARMNPYQVFPYCNIVHCFQKKSIREWLRKYLFIASGALLSSVCHCL